MAKAILDKWVEKFTSRKLLVWMTATALMFTGSLESSDYVILSAI